jgi:acyl-coenzyme A synthetase/AMP-(fatty) acid ligase
LKNTPENKPAALQAGNGKFPLLAAHAPADTLAWHDDGKISAATFLRHVHAVASRLPAARYAINLCEDRYWFLVGFAALLVNNQTNLLPPSRASGVIEEIADDYPESVCVCDCRRTDIRIPLHRIDEMARHNGTGAPAMPLISGRQLAAIVFTSGSTGRSSPNDKYWQDLVTGTRMKQRRFGFGQGHNRHGIIATVPPQHMYGLETSILNPLINGVSVYTGNTFFPADVQAALQAVSAPRVLITTPTHLRSCIAAGLDWPGTDYIVSATAPLDKALAGQAEAVFNCPVLEMYGCTETGSLASRRTLTQRDWLLYDGLSIRKRPGACVAAGPNLPGEVPLHDAIEPVNGRQFTLHGRHADMVNIAGKRASLEDLNLRLRSINGVEDAVYVVSEPVNDARQRLTALVAAPTLDAVTIRRQLARLVDPVFLPRPLWLVESLPRNETGKLPRSALLDMLRKLEYAG